MIFWRMINLELWMREFIDERSFKVQKSFKVIKANKGKKNENIINNKKYLRYPIKTELFKDGDNYEKKITDYIYMAMANWLAP